MKKRLLSALLSLCMMLTMVPAAFAASVPDCPGGDSCTHAAAIGDVHYDTLQEAFDAAQNDDTVALLRNVAITPQGGNEAYLEPQIVIANKDVIFDLQSYTLSFDSSVYSENLPYFPLFISVNTGATLRVIADEGGTITAECGNNGAYGIDILGGEVIVDSGTFYGAPTALQIETGTLTINGGTFDLASTNKEAVPSQAKYVINCIF